MIGMLGPNGPIWFEDREQLLAYLKGQTQLEQGGDCTVRYECTQNALEKEENTRAIRDEWSSQWYD
jgi:hypothetical protein